MLHAMQGSESEHSYARNSACQNYFFHAVAKPRLGEAIKHLVCKSLLSRSRVNIGGAAPPRYHIAVADLGCSHGRNTLDCAEFVVHALHQNLAINAMDIQYFFSDLPSNDFNSLFQSLQPFNRLHGQDSESGIADPLPKYFAAGVPGSFYGSLFPRASLDLVISSYSLHWLSQVPPSLVDKTSPAWNGGHTWISAKAKASTAVTDAYARQSAMDVRNFLKSRAHELTSGGILFLSLVTRSSRTSPEGESANGFIPLESALEAVLDYAWKEMVDEGLITSEEMDMFNLRWYYFTQQELESAVKDVPELRVLHIETMKDMALLPEAADRKQMVEEWVGMLSSTIEPGVEAHVGCKSKAEELLKKLKTICLNQDCLNARITVTPLVASLQRL